jgi:hypothetical protein
MSIGLNFLPLITLILAFSSTVDNALQHTTRAAAELLVSSTRLINHYLETATLLHCTDVSTFNDAVLYFEHEHQKSLHNSLTSPHFNTFTLNELSASQQ